MIALSAPRGATRPASCRPVEGSAKTRRPVAGPRRRVGFLGYCSVIPEGGEAAPGKVGIAPLRIKTEYEGRGPHASPRVIARPDDRDMRMILDDVARLRREVDIVVVAFH